MILFDLDGTLVDSRLAFARSVNAALAAYGLPTRPEAELHAYLGPPIHETFSELGAGEAIDACVEAYRARYRERGAEESTVFAGIPEVLTELGRRSVLVVATSKPHALAEPLLVALGLRQPFAAVVGPELAAVAEPKAETVRRALAHRPDGESAVMVGDRRHDIAGAHANGIAGIGVLWGIGGEAELVAAGADHLAREPADLLRLVGRPA